ncbi:carbohydrate ABC transporter permease [Microbacterium sp.]|uniref:carbohydrate ABC transporter permease n=1 Tax=Microbacterium sp. TaxID=51671 RepID=UPI003C72AC13
MTTTAIRRPRRPWSLGRTLRSVPKWIIVTILLIVVVYPLFWLLTGSLKTQTEFLNNPTWALPENWFNFDNYVSAWVDGNLPTYFRNSILAVFPSLLFTIVLGVAAGFALEVMVWKGRGTVLLMFLAGIMIPGQMILLPLFTIYFRAGLTNSLWPLIITYTVIGLPLTVFMMATYFRSVPREIFEAATLDGANIYRTFWSVGFPMVRNAVFTVALVQFFFIWNDLLIALTFTTKDSLRTIQVGLLNFTGQFGQVQYGPTFAAISINVVATLALYLFLNQRIMKGMAAGAVKG